MHAERERELDQRTKEEEEIMKLQELEAELPHLLLALSIPKDSLLVSFYMKILGKERIM